MILGKIFSKSYGSPPHFTLQSVVIAFPLIVDFKSTATFDRMFSYPAPAKGILANPQLSRVDFDIL